MGVDGEALGGRDALGREEDGGPEAEGFVDDGVEEGEGFGDVGGEGEGIEFGAEKTCVLWVRGEVHQDEGQRCGGGFAPCADDQARFAVEEGTACGGVGRVLDELADYVGSCILDLGYVSAGCLNLC